MNSFRTVGFFIGCAGLPAGKRAKPLARISHKKLGNKSESIRKFRDHNKTQRKNFDFHENSV